MSTVLIVEDDPILGRSLCLSLESQNYEFVWVTHLKAARDLLEQNGRSIDVLLLDLNLPDGLGLDFLRELKTQKVQFPIIILTANTNEETVVQGLEGGASDYIRKPFGTRELLARLKNVLKDGVHEGEVLKYGGLVLYKEKRKILHQEKEIELKRKEYDILLYFIKHAERVVTREDLLSAVSNDEEIFDRTIDSHISKIRQQLKNAGAEQIKINSVYGVGYKMEIQK